MKYYIEKIINEINEIESKIKDKIKNIYDYFISDYKGNITNYIDKNYINELNNNYSNCRDYSHFLSNKDNNELFNNIIDDINNIYGYCFNYNNNYNLKQKIDYIINDKNCFNDFFQNENNTYLNETLDFFDCYKNDFYNETAFYFDNLDDKYKMELDNVMNEFRILIVNNEIDENFLMNYSEEYLELEAYKEIDVDKISNYIENIESIIRYANSISNYDLNNYLFDKLVASFNESYYNLFNNYILKELIDNITILINNKYEIYLDYIMNKINDEFEYYLLIINQTDEIGENSKKAFIDLYERIDEKINETIFYFIEEEVYSYLDNFYKSNNKYLRINFINYYKNKINKYNINLDKFANNIDEAILNKNFNNTLDSISEEIYNNLVIKTIKNTINESISSKVKVLTDKINQFNETIQEIFINIKTKELPDNMLSINNLINNFSEILNNQTIRFDFKISNESLLSLSEFISKELEPPLLLIKDKYNIIEDNLLNETIGLIRAFPDYYSIIKQKFNLESIIDNITIHYNYTKQLFMNYTDVLDKDLQLYINKLIHFTFIDGLNFTDIPCDEDNLCKNYFEEIISNKLNLSEERRLEEKPMKQIKNIIFKNSKINDIQGTKNKRKLNGYNSKNNSITTEDIDDFILDLKETLLDFNKSYLSKEYNNMNNSLIIYLENIRNNYLGKLKKNIDIVGSKFKTILTEEIYKKLEQELFKQYYEIESFILDSSAQFEKHIKDYMFLLNYSSKLIELNYYLVYWRAKGYFQLFSQLIEESLQYISDEELKNSNYRQLKERNGNRKKKVERTVDFNSSIAIEKDNIINEWDDSFSISHYGNDSDNSSDAVNDSIIIDPEFYNEAIPLNNNPPMESVFCFKIINIYPFNTNISELEYSIEFKINSRMTADICVNLKALFDKEESLVSIGTDGRAKVDFTGEYNLYIPSQNVEHYTMVKVGLDGVLGGTIGMNLNLYLNGKNKDMYSLDCYNIINSYEIRNYNILQSEFDNINSNNFTIPWNETVKQNEIYYGIKQYYQINSNQKVEEQCIETTRKYISGTINETITQCE